MASNAQMTDVTIPMIEEHVETGLSDLLGSYRSTYIPGGEREDMLSDRFTLLPSRSLPEFDHEYAKAYEAQDHYNKDRHIYAMVCDNMLPYNLRATNELVGYSNPTLVSVLGAGTVKCSNLNESRQVIFFERPQGNKLSDFIRNQGRMHEHKVIDTILQPACKALNALHEKGIPHGNIHPGAFFLTDSTVLGEGLTMPAGSQSHYLYKPVERLICDPLGHGDASEKTDIYALTVLAFELMYGLEKKKAIPRDDFIRIALKMGTYHAFTNGRDFSDAFQDLFRGVLNDSVADRWGIEQFTQWIGGKRFNVIAPSPPKEAVRPLVFANEPFFSRRLLANSFHRYWREARKEVQAIKLDRWCETSLHRPELAENIERALRGGSDRNATDWQLNEMMTKIISLLDPVGPIRTLTMSIRPDGIGITLADMMRHKGSELTTLLGIIESNISTFWLEQDESHKSPDMSVVMWKLQRARHYMKHKAFGFGLERILYELNTSLPCQSPILMPYHVTTAADALKTLDALAPTLAPDTAFTDRHLAAFIAAKIDMGKEIKLNDLTNVPALATNQELIVLRILAKAQQKQNKLVLVGLSTWAAMRIEKMIDEIHNRIIRKRLKLQLKKLASSGSLVEVLGSIINRDMVTRDLDGFSEALALHSLGQEKILRLENEDVVSFKARDMGGRIATNICYTAMVITGYIKLADMLGL